MMKRDMDLIRLLLIKIEEEKKDPIDEKYKPDQILFHKYLLIDAGLAYGMFDFPKNEKIPIKVSISCLTWKGYEFLDKIRSETIWAKVKDNLVENGLSSSVDFIIQTCLSMANSILK